MRFRVLGPVEVADGERRLTFGSAHQRMILAVLLVARGAVVSADALIDALWGDTPPPTAKKALQSHLSRLRRALRDAASVPAITTEADGYRVDLADHHLDAREFEDTVARAARAADAAAAVELLDGALALWRGPAFGEHASHPSLQAEAARLEELRASALSTRIDARLAVGDARAVVGELEALIAAAPLTERPYGQLMVALYRSGRQADALAVFRRLRTTLEEELGIDPTPDLQRLHQRILAQDLPGDGEPWGGVWAGRESTAAVAPLVGVPARSRDRLIGRDDEAAELVATVVPGKLITLTGPGGVGKTRLAERVVAGAASRFEDGAVWCDLAPLRDPAGVPIALLDVLAVPQVGEQAALERALAAVGSRQLLLVLDCCEHVLGGVAALVTRLRERCPNLAIVTTSREHLRLPGEQLHDVAPLAVPAANADAAQVAASPAGALFCRRAREAEPSFALRDDNAATIAQLCRRLDGIPLALELAAARMRALSPEAIVARIDRRFELLTGGSPGVDDRHQTLHALVDWSYQLLTAAEARMFDRLAVFAGSFTLDAAEQVTPDDPTEVDDVAGLLAELVDKSLVVVERGAGEVRYRLLDSLRAYGLAQLQRKGELDLAQGAHARYHVTLAVSLGAAVTGADEQAALADLAAVLDDLRVAQEWLLEGADTGPALQLAAALHDDLVFRPRSEVFAWAERALQLPDATTDPAAPSVLATVARGAMNRGDLARARACAEQALAASGDDRATLWAQYVLTTVALYEGRLDDALALADRRAELADTLGSAYHRSLAAVSRSLAELYRGDPQAAIASAKRARVDAEGSGSWTARAWALYSHGEACLETAPDQAAELLEQAIVAAREVDRRFIVGVALVSLASLTGRRGDTRRALSLFRDTLAHWRSLGAYTQQLTTLRNLVELLVRVGHDRAAALLYGAVTAAATPTFGVEAERLTAAWVELERRLGPAAERAATRGRDLTEDQVVEAALEHLDQALAMSASDA